MNKIWQASAYLKYLIRSFHLHGIHSPFVFELNENIFQEKIPFYAFEEIESIRAKLLLSHQKIKVEDHGAGSKKNNTLERRISDIARTALKSPSKAQLLFRLARHLEATKILELGTSLGLTTAYLSKARKSAQIISIEGSKEIAKVAKINFEKLELTNIELIQATFGEALENQLQKLQAVDLVFFDGNHQKIPTLSYFESCLKYAHADSVFVFDDIYWSKEMKESWEIIKQHKSVSLTIDLFEM